MRCYIKLPRATYDRLMERIHDAWTIDKHYGFIHLEQTMNIIEWFNDDPDTYIGLIKYYLQV